MTGNGIEASRLRLRHRDGDQWTIVTLAGDVIRDAGASDDD
jgi:hypothetical protein